MFGFSLFAVIFALSSWFDPHSIYIAPKALGSINKPIKIKIRLTQDFDSLDWLVSQPTQAVLEQIMDGLISIDHTGNEKPHHALRWTYKNRGRTLVFHLGHSKWHKTKKPVCAVDYINAWNQALFSSTSSPYAHYFDFIERNSKAAPKLSVAATGCHTLIIRLKRPDFSAHKRFAHWIFFPISSNDKGEPYWTNTNGPYLIKEWKRGSSYLLEKNPFYIGSRKPHIDQLEFMHIADDSTALRLYESGSIHWMKDLPVDDYKTLIGRKDFYSIQTAIGYYLGFNLKGDNALSPQQRCSIKESIDTELIPNLLTGSEIPAKGNWLFGFASNEMHKTYDRKNNHHLNLFKDPLVLNFYNKDIHKTLMSWIQHHLKHKLDIDVQLKMHDGKSYWSELRANPPQIFLGGTTAWFMDDLPFLEEFSVASTANWGRYESSQYEYILERIRTASNNKKRKKLMRMANHLLVNKDCVIIPLYFRKTAYLQSTHCTGSIMNALGTLDFTQLICTQVTQKNFRNH